MEAMKELFGDLFGSWRFAKALLNCGCEDIPERVDEVMRTNPVLQVKAHPSSMEAGRWAIYLCPWDWLQIPVNSMPLRKRQALAQCMSMFSVCDYTCNEGSHVSRSFSQNQHLLKYFDRVGALRACFTFGSLQLHTAGVPLPQAQQMMREAMTPEGTTLPEGVWVMLPKGEAPELWQEASKPSLFY